MRTFRRQIGIRSSWYELETVAGNQWKQNANSLSWISWYTVHRDQFLSLTLSFNVQVYHYRTKFQFVIPSQNLQKSAISQKMIK